MRILIITSTPPIPTWGGAMAFYRHFCERRDFQISVITDNSLLLNYQVPYEYLLISRSNAWLRLSRTRFYKLVHTWGNLFGYLKLSRKVIDYSTNYRPEAVLTVAGSWSWMTIMARDVARKLKVPLIGSFNDWWYYNVIRIKWFDRILEMQFKKFYRDCDLALCTSEGMRLAMGPHKNAVLIYPTGALLAQPAKMNGHVREGNTFKVAFGGNIGEWYGKMLEQLLSTNVNGIEFSIFGSNPSWSPKFDAEVRKKGIYRGQVTFEVLRDEMEKHNALLLLMGFDKASEQIERTSFKTKFLDYLSFQRPILVWGPEYCSAVAVARKFDSAEICTSPSAHDFLETIQRLKSNVARQQELIAHANKMYEEEFHPDKIHAVLVNSVKKLLKQQP